MMNWSKPIWRSDDNKDTTKKDDKGSDKKPDKG